MTSLKQIEANRRNAQKSTGPNTLEGKEQSRCNALRHGLTAETVIGVLESAEDYTRFEEGILTEYHPKSVLERELVTRLASLLWRLRRATAIETGLFEAEVDPLAAFRRSLLSAASATIAVGSNGERQSMNSVVESTVASKAASLSGHSIIRTTHSIRDSGSSLIQCFLRLANQPNFPLDRLSRYEVALWRQADQIMAALGNLRNSAERASRVYPGRPRQSAARSL